MDSVGYEEMAAFRQQIEDAEVNTQPLISEAMPFSALLVEYEAADPMFLEKITVLSKQFDRYRKSRGDGNCFFRSFAFCLIEHLAGLADFGQKTQQLQQSWSKLLADAHFDKEAYEDFLQDSFEVLDQFRESLGALQAAGTSPAEWLAEDWRSNPLKSNTLVVVLRMLVSAHLQLNAEAYLPFIYEFSDPAIESQPARAVMEDFCRRHVEAIGVESDQIHIIAVTKIMGCCIQIVYLDASQDVGNMVMSFGDRSGSLLEAPMSLLYRPGHYDIVYASP